MASLISQDITLQTLDLAGLPDPSALHGYVQGIGRHGERLSAIETKLSGLRDSLLDGTLKLPRDEAAPDEASPPCVTRATRR